MSDGWKCAQEGDLNGLKLHLSRHPDDINVPNSDGKYMLVLAVFGSNYDVIEYLLENGADTGLGDMNDYFKTAIHLAVARSEYGIVELLISYGACSTTQNIDGNTALHIAISWCSLSMVELLLGSKNVFINVKNKHNERPIDVAVSYGRVDVALLLLECGSMRPLPSRVFNNESQKCYSMCMEWKPRSHMLVKLRMLYEKNQVTVYGDFLANCMKMKCDIFSELVGMMGV